MTVRLVLVEDHPIVADGLRVALAAQPDVHIVGGAATLADARQLLATTPCDVVLLDLRLPDGSGIDLLRDRDLDAPGPDYLILSSFQTPEYVSAAVVLGASGFLLKTVPASEILAAVTAIAGGRLLFTADQLRAARSGAWRPLTAREHQIIEGVIDGRSNEELAGDLGLSRKTVEAYITRLLARYGFMTRTELAVHADREQLLDLPTRPELPRSG
jgi:DNA-binding NarL/FixJ family response regulator